MERQSNTNSANPDYWTVKNEEIKSAKVTVNYWEVRTEAQRSGVQKSAWFECGEKSLVCRSIQHDNTRWRSTTPHWAQITFIRAANWWGEVTTGRAGGEGPWQYSLINSVFREGERERERPIRTLTLNDRVHNNVGPLQRPLFFSPSLELNLTPTNNQVQPLGLVQPQNLLWHHTVTVKSHLVLLLTSAYSKANLLIPASCSNQIIPARLSLQKSVKSLNHLLSRPQHGDLFLC